MTGSSGPARFWLFLSPADRNGPTADPLHRSPCALFHVDLITAERVLPRRSELQRRTRGASARARARCCSRALKRFAVRRDVPPIEGQERPPAKPPRGREAARPRAADCAVAPGGGASGAAARQNGGVGSRFPVRRVVVLVALQVVALLALVVWWQHGSDHHHQQLKLAAVTTPAATTHRFDVERALRTVRMQLAAGPRPAASPQLRALAEKLRRRLPDAHFEDIPDNPGMRNIVGELPGTEPAIVLGAHYETINRPKGFVGANDAAAAVGALIEIAHDLRHADRGPDAPAIKFVLFDGEEELAPTNDFYANALRGSKAYMNAHAGPGPRDAAVGLHGQQGRPPAARGDLRRRALEAGPRGRQARRDRVDLPVRRPRPASSTTTRRSCAPASPPSTSSTGPIPSPTPWTTTTTTSPPPRSTPSARPSTTSSSTGRSRSADAAGALADDDAVAAVGLGGVQRLVGGVDRARAARCGRRRSRRPRRT